MKLSKIHRGKGMESEWYVSYTLPGWKKPKQVRGGINRGKTLKQREALALEVKAATDEIIIEAIAKANREPPKPKLTVRQGLEWAWGLRKDAWRKGSQDTIRSKIEQFYEVIKPDSDIQLFGTEQAMQALKDISFGRGKDGRLYNDYKQYIGSFFKDLKDAKKINENPFDFKSRVKKPPRPEPVPLTDLQRAQITDYLKVKDPYFLNYIMVFYYTAMRPSEIFKIRIRDIRMKDPNNRYIMVYRDNVKDRQDRAAIIPNGLAEWFNTMEIPWSKKDWYLFGQGYMPEKREKPKTIKYYRQRWKALKDNLELDTKFYWIKHTAIDALEDARDGAGTQQAGHSLATVTKTHYRSKKTAPIVEAIKNMKKF